LPTPGEILFGVIDDAIRTDGSDHVYVRRTAYARHIRGERLCHLDCERTDASRRTVD
jgi:hypothetical protein